MEAELALKAATTVAPNTGSSSCLNHQALLQEGKRQSPTRELEGAQRGNAAPALGFQLSSAIPNSVLSSEGSRCTLRSCLCSTRLSALLRNKPQQGQRLFSAANSCFPSIPSSWHHSCICQHSSGQEHPLASSLRTVTPASKPSASSFSRPAKQQILNSSTL